MASETLYQRINDLLGKDYMKLDVCDELLKSLNKEKSELEFTLKAIQNKVPTIIEETLSDIKKIRSSVNEMSDKLNNFLKTCNKDKVEDAFEKLATYSIQKREYSKQLHYYKTLMCIETCRLNLRKYCSDNYLSECISSYTTLCLLMQQLYDSECQNIREYLMNMVLHWHEFLKVKLISEYEILLKTIDWPFVIRKSVQPIYPSNEYKDKFQLLSKLLLEVELPGKMRPKPVITSSLVADFPVLSSPISLLLEPFRKRFVYHFCGTRQTNRLDKPEWMFSLILTWIKDHELFLIDWLQPVCDETIVSVKVQFMIGLVKIVTEKLDRDLIQLQCNDSLFTHTLDETLGFHQELITNFGYPLSCPSVLSVLTQAQIFVKWIYVEKKSAEKRLDDIFNSNSLWTIVSENEKCKITECGDRLMTLIFSITQRYSYLPQPGHRLQFLDFQLDLIDDFRLRLAQLKRDDYEDIFNSDLPAILNTIHYVKTVLQEWGSDMHFLMLQHFKNQTNPEENPEDLSVFDDVLALMNHFLDELTNIVCTSVMLEIGAKSRSYRKDRWNIMPPMDPHSELTLTISGCAMFQVLSNKLHEMHSALATEIFTICWRYVADQLSKLIIDDVILANGFSIGGAQQIKFDVTHNILPLFAQFSSKPEAYFKTLIEACDLLSMDPQIDASHVTFKVTSFSIDQINTILSRRSTRSALAAYN